MRRFLLLLLWAPFACGMPAASCPKRLGAPRVEVYVGAIPEVEGIEGPLSWDERTAASRFASSTRSREYVGSRIVLRQILGAYLALEPDQVPLVVPPGTLSQKPIVAANPPLSFNMSHSRGQVAVAVWRGRRGFEVGVDLEKLRTVEDLPELAGRYFNDAETGLILRAEDRVDEFFRFWTLKEAYVKALGTGLTGQVRDLSTLARPDAWMESFRLEGGYRLGLAVVPAPAEAPRVVFRALPAR